MSSSITIRDLRNHFPKVRKLLESDGEVVLTERGKPKYRLTVYTPRQSAKAPAVDYWERLNSYQPLPLTQSQSEIVDDDNRGDR